MQKDIIPNNVKIELYNSFYEDDNSWLDINKSDIKKVNFINTITKRFSKNPTNSPKGLIGLVTEIQKQYNNYLRIKKLERICK